MFSDLDPFASDSNSLESRSQLSSTAPLPSSVNIESNPFSTTMPLPSDMNKTINTENSSNLDKVSFYNNSNPFIAIDNSNQQFNKEKELFSFDDVPNPFIDKSVNTVSDENKSKKFNPFKDSINNENISGKTTKNNETIFERKDNTHQDLNQMNNLLEISLSFDSNSVVAENDTGIKNNVLSFTEMDTSDQNRDIQKKQTFKLDDDDFGISWDKKIETTNQDAKKDEIMIVDDKERKEDEEMKRDSGSPLKSTSSSISIVSMYSMNSMDSSLGDSTIINNFPPASLSNNINAGKQDAVEIGNVLGGKPLIVFSGDILARVTTQSIFARRWKPHFWVIVNRRLWIYRTKQDYQENDYLIDPFSKRIKQCIALRSDIKISEIKNKKYPGHELPLQVFNLEQFDDDDGSRTVLAKFGAYQYTVIKTLWNYLDTQLFEEKHGMTSQRIVECKTNALKISQKLNGERNGGSLHEAGRYNDNSKIGNAYVREFF